MSLTGFAGSPGQRVATILEGIRPWLTEQGPIDVFVHHNPLHHFQHRNFAEVVKEAHERIGVEVYLSHREGATRVAEGKTGTTDLMSEIMKLLKRRSLDANENLLGTITRAELWHEIACVNSLFPSESEIAAFFRQTLLARGALEAWVPPAFRLQYGDQEKLRRRIVRILEILTPHETPASLGSQSPFIYLSSEKERRSLTSFLGAAFDRGFARWRGLNGMQGLLLAATEAMPGLHGLRDRLLEQFSNLPEASPSPAVCRFAAGWCADRLQEMEVPPQHWETLLWGLILEFRGWAGTISLFENKPCAEIQVSQPSLIEFATIRLALSGSRCWQQLQDLQMQTSEASSLNPQHIHTCRALECVSVLALLQRAQLGFPIEKATDAELRTLYTEICNFSLMERREVLHRAFERSYRQQILYGLEIQPSLPKEQREISCQAIFCIDDREESLRRHLEDVYAGLETFGYAGFFALDMIHKLPDGTEQEVCPPAANAKVRVAETPAKEKTNPRGLKSHHVPELSEMFFRTVQKWSVRLHHLSKHMTFGMIISAVLGLAAFAPLILRVVFPLRTKKLMKLVHEKLGQQAQTQVVYCQNDAPAGRQELLGFTISALADRVEAVLRTTGIAGNPSHLILVIGHGSSSLNNPHESAYDCGACGGKPGGFNARVFAQVANDPRVRAELSRRGIELTEENWFVGGYHDTCSDEVQHFDQDVIPEARLQEFARWNIALQQALRLNAQERCRKFQTAPAHASPLQALLHVESRARDMREPRPEYCHATNALCIVGRRQLTKQLFLDRRAFLCSYDPELDEKGEILKSLLSSVLGVCSGINLEYYFSSTDNEHFGCGSKLPLNTSGLLGVITGSSGDLRTGLSQQMVEIHEPMRLFTIVETTPKRMESIMDSIPQIGQILKNEWIFCATVNPEDGRIHILEDGEFVPFATSSPHPLPSFRCSAELVQESQGEFPIALVRKRSAQAAGGMYAI